MTAGVAGLQPKHTNADGLAQKLDDGRGMIIISACRAEELSVILEGGENSLFSQCMIEVLRGDDKHEGEDAFVYILETVDYIFRKVKKIYPKQNPYANIQISENFVLSFASKLMDENADEAEIEALVEATKASRKELVTKFRESENANSVILFVHGFSGDAENTFSQAPKLLINNKGGLDGWDMFPLGYSSNVMPEMGKSVWACSTDIERNSGFLLTSINNKFSKYKRIAVVAHDLGGIVVQQALLELNEYDLGRISHVMFYATPSYGLPEIELQNFFTYGNDEKDLKEGSQYMRNLRNRWDEAFPADYPFTFKTIAATKDEYVPISSSLEPFPKKYHEIIEGDHFSIVQITNENDDSYQLLLNTLTNKSFLNKSSNIEEINIAMGEYNEVINSLLPKLKELDNKGLERLIYALEAAGREEEAIQILNETPAAKNNSNLLGIMGGRYKRQYLLTSLAEDLKMAFKHYSDALKISEDKGDYSQIYYHAINLAFLSLMKRERGDMTAFADKAFQATEKDPFPGLWKLATMGEIFLYKGDFENSKENYGKAAAMADLREKVSIHANAYNAYVSLMQTDNPEDEYIKFLKINFLS